MSQQQSIIRYFVMTIRYRYRYQYINDINILAVDVVNTDLKRLENIFRFNKRN